MHFSLVVLRGWSKSKPYLGKLVVSVNCTKYARKTRINFISIINKIVLVSQEFMKLNILFNTSCKIHNAA